MILNKIRRKTGGKHKGERIGRKMTFYFSIIKNMRVFLRAYLFLSGF